MGTGRSPRKMTGKPPLKAQPFNDPEDPKILTFSPTMDQFKDFLGYIEFMESRNAHFAGIAKIRPPNEWRPRQKGYRDVSAIRIEKPISQTFFSAAGVGVFQVDNKPVHAATVATIADYGVKNDLLVAPVEAIEDIEREFWRQLSSRVKPVYGADSAGTLFDEDVEVWNISKLPSLLRIMEKPVPGVNTPYLYFGMWRACFAWHVEDFDLYSINYIHEGADKFWYSVAPSHGHKLEKLANSFFPSEYRKCKSFLRHKTTLIAPDVLARNGIPYFKTLQHEGEIIVTFPFAYHSGFNCGQNVAESTNFATERWIEYGKYASACQCHSDNVKIDMDIFVRTYQPEQVDSWIKRKERCGVHPEKIAANKRRLVRNGSICDLIKIRDQCNSDEVAADEANLNKQKRVKKDTSKR